MDYLESTITSQESGRIWRPIHYLGSKLRAAPYILERIDDLRQPGTAVCDLFAGSGTVASALAQRWLTVAGDIQEYSRTICSALLTPPTQPPQLSSVLLQGRGFRKDLIEICEPLLEYEHRALAALRNGNATPIVKLQQAAPLQLVESTDESKLGVAIRTTTDRLQRAGLSKGPDTILLRHFAGSYFSVQQAVDLCALLEAARNAGPSCDQQTAAALSVASEIVNSVGKQFAQPLKLIDANGHPKPHLSAKVLKDKQVNALELYDVWIHRYGRQRGSRFKHRVIRSDYVNTLRSHCTGVSVIYADPPYGREHYSRYYHVLETMARGDEPTISRDTSKRSARWSTGAYRSDRHQSPFCIRSQAPDAFHSLFLHARSLSASLVVSYSPAATGNKPRLRVIDIDHLIDMAKTVFPKVEIEPILSIEHNKLNRISVNSSGSGSEVLIVCS